MLGLLAKVFSVAQLAVKGVELAVKGKGIVPKLVPNFKQKDWIQFDVGGVTFKTTKRTLKSDPNSIFILLLADERKKVEETLTKLNNKDLSDRRLKEFRVKLTKISHNDDHNEHKFLFDRDPFFFGPVLNYLRTGKLIHNEGTSLIGILEEAKFFEVKGLVKLVEEKMLRVDPELLTEANKPPLIKLHTHHSEEELKEIVKSLD